MPARFRPDNALMPAELGSVDGLAYALFLPPRQEARGAVVVLHGAGSCKESHFDFARLCARDGLAALCFDARGHGDSGGRLDGRALDDVVAMAARARAAGAGGRVALRGSSMGGLLALAAAAPVRADAVVAICPASVAGMRRGFRDGRFDFPVDVGAVDALLAEQDLLAAAAGLGQRLLLLHAEGDEQVPVTVSDELHAAAPGSRYLRVPGGHHRSIQHDAELQAASSRWLRAALEPAPTA